MTRYKPTLGTFISFWAHGTTFQFFVIILAFMVFNVKDTVSEGLLSTYYFSSHELKITQGKVLAVNTIEHEDSTSYEYQFEFKDDFNEPRQNFSYSGTKQFSQGDSVVIEYVFSTPHYARISGTQYLPQFAITAFIMPLVILALLGWPIKRFANTLKAIYIISRGNHAIGKCTNNTESALKTNDQPMYYAHFEFEDQNGKTQTFKQLSVEPKNTKLVYTVFYLPKKPKTAFCLQVMPGECVVNQQKGKVQPQHKEQVLYSLIGPAVFILAVVI